jgi:4-amino-4-deoxy-L-arabinose transferase-like glycosyltransferase
VLVTVVALGVLALAVLVQDLAPPTDYDGLLYHLVAPQAYLQAHGIVYLPHNFSANLPMLGEMLYTFGLAGGTDRQPQLLHGVTGALTVGLSYALGARYAGRRPAFWGAAALAATPLLPFLATRAYIDLFTTLYGLLALFGVLRWNDSFVLGGAPVGAGSGAEAGPLLERVLRAARSRDLGWLRLAGVGAGLALATKYAAATMVLLLGLAVLVGAYRRQRHLGRALLPPATLAIYTAVVALPWYARQAIVLGSPVWPMYFGGRDWDAPRVAQLTYFVEQYSTGHGLLDWLLLPWNIYVHSWRFGHVPDSGPPLLGLAAPLALLVPVPAVRWLLAIAAASFVLWARGWQDLRFLLGMYPVFALLGAAGLDGVAARLRWAPLAGLAIGAVVASLCLQTAGRQVERARDSLAVVLGREPVTSYLQRKLPDFRAITYLNAHVPPGRATLMLGDGQIWYCRQRCIPDPAHDTLLEWFIRPGSAAATLARLRQEGVSHILLSKVDFWYLEHQDPEGRLKRQLAEFYVFKAAYLDLVYEDDATEVYRGRW